MMEIDDAAKRPFNELLAAIKLEKKLIECVKAYVNGLENEMYGFSCCISYQGRWNSEMLTEFELVSFELVRI